MGVAYDLLPLLEIDEAKVLLAIHSFTHDDLNDSSMDGGFMGSLRPYRGKLNHEAFHEVFACLKSLGPTLSEANTVDRRVIRDLWRICHWAREWATRPDGMLRRNELISDDDVATLTEWIECISYATAMFLDNPDPSNAFALYEDYVAARNGG